MIEFTNNWAYDLDVDVIKNGEINNEDVISRSIEMIISTQFGERLFNPSFGSGLQFRLFEGINEQNGETILDELIESIKRWEDRIVILENDAKIIINQEMNSIILVIPYINKYTGLTGEFKKRVSI